MTDAPLTAAPSPNNQTAEAPRLAPIETPSSWRVRLAYFLSRWQQGTVVTPLKVVWARMPDGLRLAYEMQKHEQRLSIDLALHVMVKQLVATINGCAFCQDLAQSDAQDEKVAPEKLDALLHYDEHSAFDEAEKAALTYAEEVTRDGDAASDTFNALRSHFSKREIVELAWLVAMETYYNLLNRPLGIGSDNLCKRNTQSNRGE